MVALPDAMRQRWLVHRYDRCRTRDWYIHRPLFEDDSRDDGILTGREFIDLDWAPATIGGLGAAYGFCDPAPRGVRSHHYRVRGPTVGGGVGARPRDLPGPAGGLPGAPRDGVVRG